MVDVDKIGNIYEEHLRVVFYARVSTGSDAQLNSLDNQIEYYTKFIQNKPNWIFMGKYVDEGISGKSVQKREGFLSMIDDGLEGKFDLIVTKEISRFSRNLLDSIKYTRKLLRKGVGVLFENDKINTFTPGSEFYLTLMGGMAQEERRRISERVKFGFQEAIEQNVVLGNNHIWGYRKDKGRLVIEEKEARMVRRIFELYTGDAPDLKAGCGIHKICQTLNSGEDPVLKELDLHGNKEGKPFSFSTVRGILCNPKYKGYYCGRKTKRIEKDRKDSDDPIAAVEYLPQAKWKLEKVDEDIVPPIVSEELWEKANAILRKWREDNDKGRPISYQNRYPYSGKIICMQHNTHYQHTCYHYASGDKELWQCKQYTKLGKKGCTGPKVYTSELDDILTVVMREILVNKDKIIEDMISEYLSSGSEATKKKRSEETIRNLIAKQEDELQTARQYLIKGIFSEKDYLKASEPIKAEIAKLEAELAMQEQAEQANEDFNLMVEGLREAMNEILDFQEGVNQRVVDTLLDRIEVYPTADPKIVPLKVYFKLGEPVRGYVITRGEGVTSALPQSSI